MRRRACVALAVIGCGTLGFAASPAVASSTFHPRLGKILGIVPRVGHQEIALGSNLPVVYHGGPVMRGVTVHTLFWAPSGFAFGGAPSSSSRGYVQLIQQFLTDGAHDRGGTANVFSVLPEFGDGRGAGSYDFHYSAAADSVNDTNPYPGPGNQCASPGGVATCVTDLQIEQEVDRVAGSARGLGNVWLVFLPPDVDTCIANGDCGTNIFGGYHSSFDLGHGTTVYANIPDPLIETVVPPGSDPQGNPDAETAIDVAAHELVEALTDPIGDGWMSPNGLEVGDKCEIGPGRGTPLGYAPNGSPYNQLINGSQYLLQTMWSNAASGCVQHSTATSSALPLAQVRLTQFGSRVTGRLDRPRRGVSVSVLLVRAGELVASATTSTDSNGTWGVTLVSGSRRSRHAVGDDRDEIDVVYGAGGPRDDVILTGDGGNPFSQAGWTGWLTLDTGFAVVSTRTEGAIAIEPCGQTGVLALSIDLFSSESPLDNCETEADASIIRTRALTQLTRLRLRSTDNRAVSQVNPDGALISLVISLGEPNSVAGLNNPYVPITPGGFPSCSGDLQSGVARCTGLVPGAVYSLRYGSGRAVRTSRADDGGQLRVSRLRLRGGGELTLANHSGRTLSVLHLAHLKVNLDGSQTRISSGSCEPGDYYGPPLRAAPVSVAVGRGAAGTGTICPLSGSARGLSAGDIQQTDDRSGGQTGTEVPLILDTSPTLDETIYGRFVALAGAGLAGPNGSVIPSRARVSLTVTRVGKRRTVFHAANVNTPHGVPVRALPSGVYSAKWVLTDANGDTRTVRTRFVEV